MVPLYAFWTLSCRRPRFRKGSQVPVGWWVLARNKIFFFERSPPGQIFRFRYKLTKIFLTYPAVLPDILSGIPSDHLSLWHSICGSLCAILSLAFYLAFCPTWSNLLSVFLSDILSGALPLAFYPAFNLSHFIPLSIWHSIRQSTWYFLWHSIWRSIWHSFWRSNWHWTGFFVRSASVFAIWHLGTEMTDVLRKSFCFFICHWHLGNRFSFLIDHVWERRG